MTSPLPRSPSAAPSATQDFSLVVGGPLYQLWRRTHLAGDALQMVRQRVVAISLLCWLPLLLLCGFQRQLLANVAIPFLHDLEVHSRFLVALPLLIGAELLVHQRMQPVIRQFSERALLADDAVARFDDAIASAMRLRNSVWVELGLAVFVFIVSGLIFQRFLLLEAATWYATPTPEGARYSLAGLWYAHVSLPIFQFLICRWYFRLFIWSRFLWQVSRIPLRLVVTHPDGVAGLSFLSSVVGAFAPIATAHGALFAGRFANEIFYTGAQLPQYRFDVLGLVLCLMLVVLGPLLVFAPQLSNAKRSGRREYDALAQRYVREFETKWLRGGAPEDESLIGSGDIQSLADLGNSLSVVRTMRVAPITRDSVVMLALATVAPMGPLLLTMMPLEELLKRLFGVLF